MSRTTTVTTTGPEGTEARSFTSGEPAPALDAAAQFVAEAPADSTHVITYSAGSDTRR